MLRHPSVGHFGAILLLALSGASARAQPTWTYAAAADPNPAPTFDGDLGDTALGQGMWMSSVGGGPLLGSGRIRLLNLQTFNDHALRDGPNFQDVHYTLTLHLYEGGQGGDLTFAGLLSGAVNYPGLITSVTATFLGPASQSVLVGGDRFTVTLAPVAPLQWVPFPNPPDSDDLAHGYFGGSIDAQVDVTPAGVAKSPEPSTLALAGAGLGLAAVVGWRKRRTLWRLEHCSSISQ
jgi:hypothetical protein